MGKSRWIDVAENYWRVIGNNKVMHIILSRRLTLCKDNAKRNVIIVRIVIIIKPIIAIKQKVSNRITLKISAENEVKEMIVDPRKSVIENCEIIIQD